MSRTADRTLLRVSKAKADLLRNWKEGVSTERDTGSSIDDLRLLVAADRWQLAKTFRISADRFMRMKPPRHRDAISRYYYAMYHAMRASAYVYHAGDDYEAHSDLPQYVPLDFPGMVDWHARLKEARSRRNEADYDPYPARRALWEAQAKLIRANAAALIDVSRVYLRSKGCAV